MRNMIDTTTNVTPFLPRLIEMFPNRDLTISRYMAWAPGTENNYKVIHRSETYAILDAGFHLILNSEGRGNDINQFSTAFGTRDATSAMNFAKNTLGAPDGIAIVFSCEPENLRSINSDYTNCLLPYLRAAKIILGSNFRMGLYSFGTWLDRSINDGVNEICWLPGASGWSGYQAFLNSGHWHFRQDPTGMEKNAFPGLNVDWGFTNPNMQNIGAWSRDPSLPLPPAPVQLPSLVKLGSRGDDVRRLQGLLKVSPDGVFGPITEKAVKAFQTANGLTVDGIVGNNTWRKLLAITV